MEEGFLKSGDYNIHHVRWGLKGPKILLIHSMGMDAHSMDLLAESLKDDYRVLSLTILGHGESSLPAKPLPLQLHAEIMRDCYKQLDFTPNLLIGHSVGGMMGMILTALYPEEHHGLVLVDIAPFESSRSARPSDPEYFTNEAAAREWLKERYPGFTDYYIDNRVRYAFTVKDTRYYLKPRGDAVRRGLNIDLWPYVEKIQIPTLLLIGEQSELVTPETRRRMESIINDLEVTVMKGTGHMIPQDAPVEFEKHVRKFLDNLKL